MFGLRLGPDLLYRLDTLPHKPELGFEDGAVVLDFLGVLATATAE
jgi:hypothetical protein